jgi:hypothetical protein
MAALAGPYAVVVLLLAAGGLAKAVDPGPTANALTALGFPGGRVLVRVGGVAEAGLGIVALGVASPWCAALIAASYLAFAAFVIRARRRGRALSSCGCFGKLDTPPTRLHVVVNVAAAAVAFTVAATASESVLSVVTDQPLAGVPFIALTVAATYLTFLALTALPRVLSFGAAAR